MNLRRIDLALIVALALSLGAHATSLWRPSASARMPPGEPGPDVAVPVPAPTPLPVSSPGMAEGVSAFRGIGFAVAENLRLVELHWTDPEFEAFVIGLRAGFRGDGFTLTEDVRAKYDMIGRSIEAAQRRAAAAPPGRSGESPVTIQGAMQKTARDLGLQKTDSGLFVRVLRHGSGPRPTPLDTVVLSFTARAFDGTTDIKALSAQHARVQVRDLLPGIAEGVQMLALGGSALFVLAPELSFGDRAWPAGVAPGTPLAFMVELHDIAAADEAP